MFLLSTLTLCRRYLGQYFSSHNFLNIFSGCCDFIQALPPQALKNYQGLKEKLHLLKFHVLAVNFSAMGQTRIFQPKQ